MEVPRPNRVGLVPDRFAVVSATDVLPARFGSQYFVEFGDQVVY